MAWEGLGTLHQPHRTSAFLSKTSQSCAAHTTSCRELQTPAKVLSPLLYLSFTVSQQLFMCLSGYLISALHQQSGFGFLPAAFGWGTFCFSAAVLVLMQGSVCILLLPCTAMCSMLIGGKMQKGTRLHEATGRWNIFKQPCAGQESKHKSDPVSLKLL